MLFSVVPCLLLAAASAGSDWSPYHELSMVALAPPSKLPSDAFFGYSLAYDRKSKQLVCSAPRADYIGRLYSCDLSKKQCKWLQVNMKNITYPNITIKDHYFWLGATVKADDSNLMVCAPRHLSKRGMKNKSLHVGTYGRCYSKNLLSNETEPNFELLPEMPLKQRQRGASRNENLTDSFGWSIDIAVDGSARVGSPAMANGRVMTYNMDSPQGEPSFLSGKDSTKSAINYNFGYSIASGHFLSTSHSFAVSSTYGEIGKGKVIIFEDNKAVAYLEDGEVGSMYGASLCSAQLHSTTPPRSTLLVGAPAYFQFDEDRDRYHTGMVYVYTPGEKNLVLNKKIEGPKDGGFFGYAIVNVGDMDNDNKDEIAIAAPYEDDGAGAVYVYSGAALSQAAPARPLQRLQPRGFLNFGLSLTAFSYSDNGCNDLAVGAPGNDKVAVYHCLPIIDVRVSIVVPDNMQKRPDKTSFELSTCLNASIPEKRIIKAEFAVNVKMTHGSATFAKNRTSNNFKYVASINNRKLRETKMHTCQKIQIKTDKDGNYEVPIIFDVNVKLSPDPRLNESYDPFRAIISPRSNLTAYESVIAAECRTDVCEPKLEVHVESSLLDTYVTGSSDFERIWIVVSNGDGDTAYAARARLFAGAGAEVAVARACAWAGPARADCTLPAGLRANQTWNVTETGPIVLDMTKITSESDELRLRVDLSWGKETKLAVWERAVKLRHDASKVRLQGKSNQGEIVNVTKTDIQTGKSLQHTYTIINTHGTNWKGLVCEIWLKKEVYALFKFPIQIYRGSSALSPPCKQSAHSETKEAYLLQCRIGDLYRDDTVTVVIPIYILPEKLESIYDTLNVTLETSITLHFTKKREDIDANVRTTLILQQAHVPLWIILCAAAVGLLLLLLLAFAMYECGCFRRKNKEMLDKLKKDVHRKSMILKRRSMRLSDTERASLANKTYKELLDDAEVKEAEEEFTDGPTSDQTDQPETSQLDQSDQVDKSDLKNHQGNLTYESEASEPDQSMSSMSDKMNLVENSLKMQKMKKPAAYY